MKLPEYITKEEVRRVCKQLRIRDWTKLKKAKVAKGETKKILAQIDSRGIKIDPEDFRRGLEVELEHGTEFKEANVTNNHPIVTGMIVLAHMKEFIDYYKRLEVTELEGDLFHAIAAKNMPKIKSYYKRLTHARNILSKSEAGELK